MLYIQGLYIAGYWQTYWCEELTHLKRPQCRGRLNAVEGDDRGWDGWMASLTQWTWVWVNSRSWWWTGRPGMLQSMGLQRVRHTWTTELTDRQVERMGARDVTFGDGHFCRLLVYRLTFHLFLSLYSVFLSHTIWGALPLGNLPPVSCRLGEQFGCSRTLRSTHSSYRALSLPFSFLVLCI